MGLKGDRDVPAPLVGTPVQRHIRLHSPLVNQIFEILPLTCFQPDALKLVGFEECVNAKLAVCFSISRIHFFLPKYPGNVAGGVEFVFHRAFGFRVEFQRVIASVAHETDPVN